MPNIIKHMAVKDTMRSIEDTTRIGGMKLVKPKGMHLNADGSFVPDDSLGNKQINPLTGKVERNKKGVK